MQSWIKLILLAIIFLCTNLLCGQIPTLVEWQEMAKNDIRLQPKYGNEPKTESQLKADEDFIADIMKNGENKEANSEKMVTLGFDYLSQQGDMKTAMYRFNQGYLLDKNNPLVYYGFGMIYFVLDAYDLAREQFDEALKIDPNHALILQEYGTTYLGDYYKNIAADSVKAKQFLDLAIDKFVASLNADSKNADTTYKLSIAYYQKNDCENSQQYLEMTNALNDSIIDLNYLSDFVKKCSKN